MEKTIKKATTAVYDNGKGYTLTPYVNEDGEIWLAAEGNGCGNDMILQDISGWTDDEILEQWGDIDTAAMAWAAQEIEAQGDIDSAEYIVEWADTLARAKSRN